MKRRTGFTLVEMAITIAVAGIITAGMLQATQTQATQTVLMRNRVAAMNIARLKMAEMRAGAHPAIGTATLTPDSAFPDFAIQRVVTNVATFSTFSLRKVEINVATPDGSFSSPLVRLVTYTTDVVTFGDGV